MSGLHAVALMGATGTGKSALAMTLARQSGCMIIACDSMQLYCGLDVGTAKPTQAELAEVRHAMVDCCRLPDLYSAARWAAEATECIRQANSEGITPLIVGGTGLYLRALLEGFADIPQENPVVRSRFEALLVEAGVEVLYQLLQHKDPDMAAILSPHDTQRIMRALCVNESTGIPLSVWQQRPATAVPIACPVFVLDMPRDPLRRRISERFRSMMENGWLDETRWLASQTLPETHPAMRAVGYRQLLDYLNGHLTLEEAVQKGITATHRYAKRQVTWFAHQTPGAIHGDAAALAPQLLAQFTRCE
ncbi:tRNA (adenosine(37)-N6)-dimethylallyltransferase MiaA [Mariprofundus erugo]|uniref:tRNA dimethylallyltransferase n=1 Tax=Mariprofundus erugo TaxID=2528639 RepID=A0A5R9GUD7_9PROT|nr:tRNA (adenosine(37)-N6)-dimethylallyltransferase MiaA [Mariprofundus erugo]TLS67642.1 tRNA (adenosine(37)-N6)-dimethylallyltransferase MiaA [Mariprofundus erugo]TLS73849.1 tRNA (adenosine(37)-N6)-dimethylallyltransferase MiaA [Mariprofundus erugo]